MKMAAGNYLNSEGLSKENKIAQENSSEGTKLSQNGVGDSVKREAFPKRINSVAEKIYSGYNNSHIILGKDRKDKITSGYGGKGHPKSGMVHIVAGHFGAGIGLYKEDAKNPSVSNPDFMLDSSYIYLSQTADIDDYLNLKDGTIGKSIKQSAIGIKADAVRIVGERGIKLVTRRYSEDSKRQKIIKIKGIDLIAGNDDSDLQPMLKGINTNKAFAEMINLMELTVDSILEIIHYQEKVDSSLATHQHATGVPGSPTLPLDTDLPTKSLTASYIFSQVSNIKLDQIRKSLGVFKKTYLEKTGELYIASRFNNTN